MGLNYRGYNIHDLAKHCTFEEVVHLLLFEKLPTREELDALKARMGRMRTLP